MAFGEIISVYFYNRMKKINAVCGIVSFLKNNIKIYIKTAPTCFGAVTPSSGSPLIRAC
jgi:hypothetical protein